jgi:Leucine-rich repeat (LRR) protein
VAKSTEVNDTCVSSLALKQPASSTPGKRVPSNASSAALREQIAAAKAAARKEKEKAKHDSPQQSDVSHFTPFESATEIDPFNQGPKDPKHMLRNRIRAAWTNGKLNIAAMGLKKIPDEVRTMYDAKMMDEGNVNWAEVIDLTKLIAADNEIEEIDDPLFPDRSPEEIAHDGDETGGNQFGGLELLDLHGNPLAALPVGLRRLERLTSLNMAHCKLENGCFDTISQITSLKELRLGHNNLSGSLPGSVSSLTALQILDVQCNRLLELPGSLRELVSLKVLMVAGNQLTALPMEALQQVNLLELDASNCALIGSLFPLGGDSRHTTLQRLAVANNSLAALTFAPTLDLTALQTLDATNNHLTSLPPIDGWTNLVTLQASDNKISELPDGFSTLQKLKNVDFSSNDLRMLDPAISQMDSLENFALAANPLREKKYLTMNAADIKRDLLAKLEPDSGMDSELSDPETVIGPPTDTPATSSWAVKANGLLDLPSRGLSDEVNDRLGSVLKSNEVRELRLQSNRLSAIPPALWLGQDLRILDLSKNAFEADYFSAELELPVLEELDVSYCRLTDLEPLLTQLSAPSLRVLSAIANRLTGPVPTIRASFPSLSTVYFKDNRFESVTADALRGLSTVDLSSNDLRALPAGIGLLWDEGLRNLEVSANAFRVPSQTVLKKGTEATMRWLRDKLPTAESAAVEEGL